MSLILHASNSNKILEQQLIPKYINIMTPTKTETITYNINKNINKDVIKAYKNKPDILIIDFSENKETPMYIKNIPRYPIFVNNIFYITPICYQQLNGFTNDNKNKQFIINDFIERIKKILGGIISDKDFKFKNIQQIEIESGIKNILYTDIQQNWFVNKIPKWMTTNIEPNKVGWFNPFNRIALDYIFENYKINITAELGAYYGLSTHYIANKLKNNNGSLYSFDLFDNILLTNYIVKSITPLDTNYFFKYIKFESFHSKLSEFDNVYSVKYDCFKAPELLKKYNIKVDLFYIDFCKKDKLLIEFVDHIFKLYPDCIIIGDDAVMLTTSLEYFKKKYNYVYLTSCYICSYNTKLKNVDKLLKNYKKEQKYRITTDIKLLNKIDIDYKIKYISNLMNQYNTSDEIIKKMEILNIKPNMSSRYLIHNSNLYHYIAYNTTKNVKYYSNLYNILNKKYPDNNTLNNLNLTPNDYFNDDLNILFT